jgi:hypothetical protein
MDIMILEAHLPKYLWNIIKKLRELHDCELCFQITAYCEEKMFFPWRLFLVFYTARRNILPLCWNMQGLGVLSFPQGTEPTVLFIYPARPKNYIPPVALVSSSPTFHSLGEKCWFTVNSIIVLAISNLQLWLPFVLLSRLSEAMVSLDVL